MTSRDNGKRSRQDWKMQRLADEIKRTAIRDLNLQAALEYYGVHFDHHGKALCPFHNEKTPSFRIKAGVNGEFWHCFGCGESGDLINFVRRTFGMQYSDALDTICRDFGISTGTPTIEDQERLDIVRLKRYITIKRYNELLEALDELTRKYWYAYDTLQYIIALHGGKDINNDSYVSSQYALIRARNALEQAEFECSEYLRENPQATPKPPVSMFAASKVSLPPAPKWRETCIAVNGSVAQNSIAEKR